MDISKASNFERFVFYCLIRTVCKSLLFGDVKSGKGFDLSDNLKLVSEKFGFIAGKSTHQDRLATIKKFMMIRSD